MSTKANLKIDQGADFSTSITLTDDDGNALDLTGYTGAGQIRKYYTSTTAVDFNVVVTPSTGTVSLSLSAADSNAMNSGRYVYDIELTDGSDVVSRIMEGIVTITPGVTR